MSLELRITLFYTSDEVDLGDEIEHPWEWVDIRGRQ